MIISHRKKFVFVHVPKAAGSSINLAIYKSGYRDLYFDVTGKVTHYLGNHFKCKELDQHSNIRQIINYFRDTEVNVDDYFKFVFVKNPFAYEVSKYFYTIKIANDPVVDSEFYKYCVEIKNNCKTFAEFCKTDIKYQGWQKNQIDKICSLDRKQILVDFVGKTERIQQDFNFVCDKIGIPRQKIPHINKSKHKHYTEHYDDETREIVAEKYAQDINFFKYKFGE